MSALSCAGLAAALPAIVQRHRDADEEAVRTFGTAWERVAHDAFQAAEALTLAADRLILTLPAVSLSDAAAKLVMVAARLCSAQGSEGGLSDDDLVAVERAVHSALGVVLEAADVTLDPIIVSRYLPFACIPGVSGATS